MCMRGKDLQLGFRTDPQTSQQISADIKKADFISLQQVQVIKSAFDRKGMVMRTQWFAITIKA